MHCRILVGLLVGAALVGCGGSGSSNIDVLSFVAPTSGSVPAGTSQIQITVINAAGLPVAKAATSIGSSVVMSGLPSGPVVVEAYAVNSSGTTLASGRTTATLGQGANPVSVKFSPVPAPLKTQQYVLSGTVCTNPDEPTTGRISLHAIIDETTDLAQTAYAGANFRVFEDGIELSPFTVGHSGTISNAREDICFVLDSTATEGNELQGVANSIASFASQMAAADQNVQFGGVEFGEEVRSQFPLSTSSSQFTSWVQGLTPHGGDGLADDPLDAIRAALSFKWRMDSQHILIVVTSNPIHQAGDGSGVTNETVSLIAGAIHSGFVVDSICPIATPAISPAVHIKYDSVSTVSQQLGGMTLPLPADGNVNLQDLNISALILAGYVFKIPSSLHVPPVDHTVRVVLQDNSGTPISDVFLPGSY